MLWIIVTDQDGGYIFEGNAEQHWSDTFFSNAEPQLILDFCNENNWKCEIRNYTPDKVEHYDPLAGKTFPK